MRQRKVYGWVERFKGKWDRCWWWCTFWYYCPSYAYDFRVVFFPLRSNILLSTLFPNILDLREHLQVRWLNMGQFFSSGYWIWSKWIEETDRNTFQTCSYTVWSVRMLATIIFPIMKFNAFEAHIRFFEDFLQYIEEDYLWPCSVTERHTSSHISNIPGTTHKSAYTRTVYEV
jgi:hypothetical protein